MMGSIASTAFPQIAWGSNEVAARPDQDRATMESAFSRVVEEYADFAYNVAYRMLHNVEDAEDAVQEAFISAYRAFPRFKGASKVSTWLYRIVVNSCLMKIRKDKSRAKYLIQTDYNDEVSRSWTADPEQAAISGELRDVVESELGKLSPELRATVVMRDVQGLTTEESAETLGLSIAAFKSRLHRARVLVRQGLEVYLAREK
tara:strand:+ start:3290 stop:3898 length:609 start_codon:yes stop_codon:yes gene_type:complete